MNLDSAGNPYALVSTKSSLHGKQAWCECCGERGHKFYDCPEKNWRTETVYCKNCGESSHPTTDCPLREKALKGKKKKEPEAILPPEE